MCECGHQMWDHLFRLPKDQPRHYTMCWDIKCPCEVYRRAAVGSLTSTINKVMNGDPK